MRNTEHNDRQSESGEWYPIRYCELITDENNRRVFENKNIQQILRFSEEIASMDMFYGHITNNVSFDEPNYLRERVKIYDNAFIELCLNMPVNSKGRGNIFLAQDFPFRLGDNTLFIIYKETSIWNPPKMNSGLRVIHSCLILAKANQFYFPNPVQIFNESIRYYEEFEKYLRLKVTPILMEKQPLTPAELDICEYFNEGIIESKEIARIKGCSWQTVDKHRSAICRKGLKISHALNRVTTMSSFLKGDGII